MSKALKRLKEVQGVEMKPYEHGYSGVNDDQTKPTVWSISKNHYVQMIMDPNWNLVLNQGDKSEFDTDLEDFILKLAVDKEDKFFGILVNMKDHDDLEPYLAGFEEEGLRRKDIIEREGNKWVFYQFNPSPDSKYHGMSRSEIEDLIRYSDNS